MKTQTDIALDSVEKKIEQMRKKAGGMGLSVAGQLEMQRLTLKRERLHEKQFKALQARIAKMPKAGP